MRKPVSFGPLPTPNLTTKIALSTLNLTPTTFTYVRFDNGSSIVFHECPKEAARRVASQRAMEDARRAHNEARGPGTRQRKTKVDRYPFKVDAPVKQDRIRHLTVWCRDNAVGKYRIDNHWRGEWNDALRRFHFADEQDAILFQLFSGGVSA